MECDKNNCKNELYFELEKENGWCLTCLNKEGYV